ncbi:hypothetical protein PtVFX2014_01935 [Legionella pneumophila]|nr:hypothetical protein PtVF66_01980 [Legionella pneumophila]KZX35550.1 hypothetical protein PtVFX2014_01935 [Legionella pneumophila]
MIFSHSVNRLELVFSNKETLSRQYQLFSSQTHPLTSLLYCPALYARETHRNIFLNIKFTIWTFFAFNAFLILKFYNINTI